MLLEDSSVQYIPRHGSYQLAAVGCDTQRHVGDEILNQFTSALGV